MRNVRICYPPLRNPEVEVGLEQNVPARGLIAACAPSTPVVRVISVNHRSRRRNWPSARKADGCSAAGGAGSTMAVSGRKRQKRLTPRWQRSRLSLTPRQRSSGRCGIYRGTKEMACRWSEQGLHHLFSAAAVGIYRGTSCRQSGSRQCPAGRRRSCRRCR